MKVYYTRCLIEGYPCLVAFDYGSDNDEGLSCFFLRLLNMV